MFFYIGNGISEDIGSMEGGIQLSRREEHWFCWPGEAPNYKYKLTHMLADKELGQSFFDLAFCEEGATIFGSTFVFC